MRAPRVLVAGAVLGQPMGGVRRHNAELLPRVAARLAENGGGLAVLEGATAVAFDLPAPIERIPSRVPARPVPVRAALEARAIAAALEAEKAAGRPFDVVHTGHLPVPRGLGVPLTWTVHDLRSIDFRSAPFVRRHLGGKVLARAARTAARVGVVSASMRARLLEFAPDLEGRVDLIGNGVDHLPILPREPESERPFLLHVGHVEPRKNLEVAVRALAAAPELPRLVAAGGAKGDGAERILALARDLGVRDRVELAGDVSDPELAALYARAAAAVFPSWLEGFGLGPREALRAGCPVAASAIPAHLELDGVPSFDPASPEGCADAILRAMRGHGEPMRPAADLPTWSGCAARFVDMLESAARRD